MKTKFTSLSVLVLALSFGLSMSAFAQGNIDNHNITVVIPTVALLDIEPSGSKDITATFVAPTEAGDKITLPANNTSLWLNYSSIQTGSTLKRVSVEADVLVAGIDINLVAGASGTGDGTLGTPQAALTLTMDPQILVNGIGSAYTVSGQNQGHQLTYSFVAADDNYANIRSGSPVVVVTYTLEDY
ncbi:hypothetical protein [Dyadobacter pollutisoli]|jgi:hypothetical protein|uniref:Type 1 fimbrial protein n=1 Tax=Dyadobacter pollutisoli TaxID=2910158 RepID=A0A9E8SRX9_9BACT|nr:hypothetical protein [Dyadobacter pollutisoli]WAC14702.1 hypothetical protein ON006_12215 [Dyadobacter pollutisoli]